MPLMFDLPLEKLRTYQGRNPRPEDFDAFWDARLAEMHALDGQVEQVPAAFQTPAARCSDLYFTGVGGARVHAKLLQPPEAAPAPHPAVVMFHGYSGHSGDWMDKLPYVGLGFTVAALDCRGQAGTSQDPGGVAGTTFRGHIVRGLDDAPAKMLFVQNFLDTAQLAQIVMDMPDVDADRVGAVGGSQGGGLTLACASLAPRISRVAPVFPFLCDYQRVWEMDLAVNAYQELRDYFRQFDPLHRREAEIFTQLGYIDVQHLAARIRGQVYMAVGLMDQVCPPSTQFAAYNKITADKSLEIYPDFAHEGLPGHSDRTFQFLSGL